MKLGIIFLGISFFFTNCDKNEDITPIQESDISEDYTVNKISYSDFINSNAFGAFEKSVSKAKKNNLNSKNSSTGNQYQFTGNEVLRSYVDGQSTFTIAIKNTKEEDKNYDLNLLIIQNDSSTNTFIVKYSKIDNSVIIHPVNTNQNSYSSKSTSSKNSSICNKVLWTVTSPCSCVGHTSGHCTCSNTYSSSSGSTTYCWDTPIWVTEYVPRFGESTTLSSGNDSTGGSGNTSPQEPIYIYEGEQSCDGHGNCTPPLYWAQAQASDGNPSARKLLQILNVITIDSYGLSSTQRQWVENPANSKEVNLILTFLNQNNESEESKEFAKASIDILSFPKINSTVQTDYVTQILKLTNHLKLFGNIEDEIYADYIESLIPDFNSMTINEVRAIYSQVKTTCNELTIKYVKAIVTPIVTDLVIPVVTYVLFEATAGTAIKLLGKIPNIVFQGSRLSATVSQLAQLGVQGTQSHVRVITTAAPVARAESLFLSLTKNVTPLEVSLGVLRASMGNGNFITYRTVSQSGFPATIDLNFAGIFGANTPIRVLKFTAP